MSPVRDVTYVGGRTMRREDQAIDKLTVSRTMNLWETK